jgi:hypothetical protein
VDRGVKLLWMIFLRGDIIVKKGEGRPFLSLILLCEWSGLWNEVEFGCTNRFKVKHLEIMEDFLEGEWTMATIVRQGLTLALVF